jgi:threonine dehydrogenase-like Zn-dependent dehydrogenase
LREWRDVGDKKVTAGHRGLSVDDVPAPKDARGSDVFVKVEAAGICGTDLLIYKWGDFAKSSLVLHRVALSDAQDAFDMALNGRSLKILFEPNGAYA